MNIQQRLALANVVIVLVVVALGVGLLLYFGPEVSAIEGPGDPRKAHLWYDASGYWCGEIVYWCDGSVTEKNPYCGPTMETRTWQCPGSKPLP